MQPGNWQNRLSEPVVPLSKIQIDVLRLLAAHRDPESYVAGATPLHRNTARYQFNMLTPRGYGIFFTKLREGELAGFRSELDVAMARATVGG